MWKKYLSNHLKRSTKQEPFGPMLKKQIVEQFDRMVPMERWAAMSLIENNKLVSIPQKSYVEEKFEEVFEDTIYSCEKCGSKKIDIHQVQTRGAVSVY